jgi:hypothetical protein
MLPRPASQMLRPFGPRLPWFVNYVIRGPEDGRSSFTVEGVGRGTKGGEKGPYAGVAADRRDGMR